MGHTTHSASDGLLCCSSAHLGRVKQPCGCCSVWNKVLKETGRILQNFLRFSPASGEPIWKWTPQQVSYTAFPRFSPLLTQRSKTILWFASILCPKLQDSFTCDWRGQQFLWMEWSLPSFWTICPRLLGHTHTLSVRGSTAVCPWLFLHNRKHHIFYYTAPLFPLVIYFNVSLWLFISSFPLLTVPSTAPSNLDTLKSA